MQIHHYDPVTGEYKGSDIADADPLDDSNFLIPAHATPLAPPAVGLKQAPIFVNGVWEVASDHRGEIWYGADGTRMAINSIGVEPDPAWLASPPPPPLTDVQAAACQAVDFAAGVARAKYMTIVAGQEATYQQKAASCRKWIADGKPTTISAAIYPGLNADYEARRRHGAATSLQTTVDEILATEALWMAKLDAIELARRAGKIAISVAADSTAVDAARDAALSELAGL